MNELGTFEQKHFVNHMTWVAGEMVLLAYRIRNDSELREYLDGYGIDSFKVEVAANLLKEIVQKFYR